MPLIAYSSGERGLISQILSPKYGGFLVYGTIEGDSVPGLPTLASLREAYKVHCINEETKVFGLISKPVGHSKGPMLHNPVLRHANFNGVYVPMLVDDLQKFFGAYPSHDFVGFRYLTQLSIGMTKRTKISTLHKEYFKGSTPVLKCDLFLLILVII